MKQFFKPSKAATIEDRIASVEWHSWNLWRIQHLWTFCLLWFGSTFIPVFQERGCKEAVCVWWIIRIPRGAGVAVFDEKDYSSVDQSQCLKSSRGLKNVYVKRFLCHSTPMAFLFKTCQFECKMLKLSFSWHPFEA